MPQFTTSLYAITWNPPTNKGRTFGVTKTATTISGLTSNTAYTFTAYNSLENETQSDSVTTATGWLYSNIFVYGPSAKVICLISLQYKQNF